MKCDQPTEGGWTEGFSVLFGQLGPLPLQWVVDASLGTVSQSTKQGRTEIGVCDIVKMPILSSAYPLVPKHVHCPLSWQK